MAECVFCNIIEGKIPAKKLHEDEEKLVIFDIRPQAPHHLLLIPKKHIETLSDLDEADEALMGRLMRSIKEFASQLELPGYRVVINCGKDAGQEVYHLHVHVLAGRKFTWPPG